MTESVTQVKKGLVGSLITGPAVGKLAEEAGKYAAARAERLAKRMVGGGSSGAGSEGGGSPKAAAVVEGAKNAIAGKSGPATAVRSAATALREKVKQAFGGIGGSTGALKMTNIEEAIDIGLPVDVVYDQWTQLAEFPKFMKGVENVDQEDEIESTWRIKVAFSRRSWKARTTEQIPDRRIVWTSEGAKGYTQGTVTFHALADDLTRVLLSMEYYPSGFFEKTGNIWRAGGRRARLDLKHFRRFISLSGEATGSWRGEIRDGEVVKQPEEGEEERRKRDEEPEAERRDDTEREEARAGEEPEKRDEREEEEEAEPARAGR
jgi:uncharacterized membrane protein